MAKRSSRESRKRQTPSQKIQRDLYKLHSDIRKAFGTDFVDPTSFELFWYKMGGRNPRKSVAMLFPHIVAPGKRRKGEKIEIHSQPGSIRPGALDLKRFVGMHFKYGVDPIIIAVAPRGIHVGYTFVQITNPEKAKKALEFTGTERLSISGIERLGFRLRFVPTLGYKFNHKTKRFSKKTK